MKLRGRIILFTFISLFSGLGCVHEPSRVFKSNRATIDSVIGNLHKHVLRLKSYSYRVDRKSTGEIDSMTASTRVVGESRKNLALNMNLSNGAKSMNLKLIFGTSDIWLVESRNERVQATRFLRSHTSRGKNLFDAPLILQGTGLARGLDFPATLSIFLSSYDFDKLEELPDRYILRGTLRSEYSSTAQNRNRDDLSLEVSKNPMRVLAYTIASNQDPKTLEVFTISDWKQDFLVPRDSFEYEPPVGAKVVDLSKEPGNILYP